MCIGRVVKGVRVGGSAAIHELEPGAGNLRHPSPLGFESHVAHWLRSRKVSISRELLAVLLLFATVQTKHAQISTELHRELCASLLRLETCQSISLNLCQQSLPSNSLNERKSTSKHFWRATKRFYFLAFLDSNHGVFCS